MRAHRIYIEEYEGGRTKEEIVVGEISLVSAIICANNNHMDHQMDD